MSWAACCHDSPRFPPRAHRIRWCCRAAAALRRRSRRNLVLAPPARESRPWSVAQVSLGRAPHTHTHTHTHTHRTALRALGMRRRTVPYASRPTYLLEGQAGASHVDGLAGALFRVLGRRAKLVEAHQRAPRLHAHLVTNLRTRGHLHAGPRTRAVQRAAAGTLRSTPSCRSSRAVPVPYT